MDLCGFQTSKPLEYVYLTQLTSEQCEANWRKLEEPEVRRYVLPLKVETGVGHFIIPTLLHLT